MHLLVPAFAAFAFMGAAPGAVPPISGAPLGAAVQQAASVTPTPPAQPGPVAMPQAAPAVATDAGARPVAAPYVPRPRQTLEQRFQGANRSGDGHLTLDQASGARWSYVTRNFEAIDQTHRGFITVDDIRLYARERRAARPQAPRPALSASSG